MKLSGEKEPPKIDPREPFPQPEGSDNLNNDSAPKSKRPPIGLKPRYIHDHERYIEIYGAIQRYYDAGKKIPVEWIEEYNELVEKEKCE